MTFFDRTPPLSERVLNPDGIEKPVALEVLRTIAKRKEALIDPTRSSLVASVTKSAPCSSHWVQEAITGLGFIGFIQAMGDDQNPRFILTNKGREYLEASK